MNPSMVKTLLMRALEDPELVVTVNVNYKNVDNLSIPAMALVAAFVLGLMLSPLLQSWWKKQ